MEENTRLDCSDIEPPMYMITQNELELVLALWALLKRIEKIKSEDERDTAEANWFELCKAFLT